MASVSFPTPFLVYPSVFLLLFFSCLNSHFDFFSFSFSSIFSTHNQTLVRSTDEVLSSRAKDLFNSSTASTVQKNGHVNWTEEGLAKARGAIREAVRTRSYMSYKDEPFVPRGSIYRNPYAFHQ
ncbi:hypothetical protein RJ639_028825 [Escallonia herrerae]|uniref:Uncharacterized protein n=1 Tax=Escallonia herrerae TaxID=1293975 RepID=A0AA89BR39_9ASTE|nr:hypothetical protein RJ639_028825 [Escallonia herrerae]